MNIEIQLKDKSAIILYPTRSQEDNERLIYDLLGSDGNLFIRTVAENNRLKVLEKASNVDEIDEVLSEKLDALYLEIIEAEQSGTENTEASNQEEIQPFDPEDIKVHAKPFSLRLVSDMIDEGDIDLSPDFQRNFVWNSNQKSRLIESILLRIPLPMFYFSEDSDGRITIVDGLQRLTTIKEFMDNKFPLKNLEYLEESCGGKYYMNDINKIGIDKKYTRWFNQTQFSVNVIDPSSPSKVKYDIFRRINTGGKPLNNQEIRNCLASKDLRNVLNKMSNLDQFKNATDNSIRSRRMEDQEVALRFMRFRNYYDIDENFDKYSGYMDTVLNDYTESLKNKSEEELEYYVVWYKNAMINAEYLFGSRYAFRKIRLKDIKPNSSKQLINKALFVCISILLSYYDPLEIKKNNKANCLTYYLANEIDDNQELFNYLSYGTNAKSNLNYVLKSIEKLIDDVLIK